MHSFIEISCAAMSSRPYDKVESSPTSRATCRICREKIMKGTLRIGEHYFFHKYEKWSVKYYHGQCVENDESVLNRLNFPKRKSNDKSFAKSKRKLEDVLSNPNKERIQMEANDIENSAEKRRRLVHNDRGSLREELRQLRLRFATRLDVPAYIIFQDTVLDAIVEAMPSNSYELLQVKGIGEKKLQSYGSSILKIIASYQTTASPSKRNQSKCRDEDDEDEDEDEEDDIEVEKALSVNEIVKQRYREAEEKGNVIEL